MGLRDLRAYGFIAETSGARGGYWRTITPAGVAYLATPEVQRALAGAAPLLNVCTPYGTNAATAGHAPAPTVTAAPAASPTAAQDAARALYAALGADAAAALAPTLPPDTRAALEAMLAPPPAPPVPRPAHIQALVQALAYMSSPEAGAAMLATLDGSTRASVLSAYAADVTAARQG